jgi:hypothetical protein
MWSSNQPFQCWFSAVAMEILKLVWPQACQCPQGSARGNSTGFSVYANLPASSVPKLQHQASKRQSLAADAQRAPVGSTASSSRGPTPGRRRVREGGYRISSVRSGDAARPCARRGGASAGAPGFARLRPKAPAHRGRPRDSARTSMPSTTILWWRMWRRRRAGVSRVRIYYLRIGATIRFHGYVSDIATSL